MFFYFPLTVLKMLIRPTLKQLCVFFDLITVKICAKRKFLLPSLPQRHCFMRFSDLYKTQMNSNRLLFQVISDYVSKYLKYYETFFLVSHGKNVDLPRALTLYSLFWLNGPRKPNSILEPFSFH